MFWWIIGIVLVVLIAVVVVLYIFGNKMQKKQMDQREQINAAAQPASMFIIDKKILPIKEAKLPKTVMDQLPKRYLKAKVPMVKAKVGPQVTTLICDESIYEDVPKHGEVKAMVSGIYLVGVKTLHSKTRKIQQQEAAEEQNGKKKKRTMREKMVKRQAEYQKQLAIQMENRKTKEEEKAQKAKEKRERERAKKIVD